VQSNQITVLDIRLDANVSADAKRRRNGEWQFRGNKPIALSVAQRFLLFPLSQSAASGTSRGI
jgi:hypothetical protein